MDDKKPPPLSNELRDALAELVACKDLKERADAISPVEPGCEKEVLMAEYRRRQPLAWERARAALSSAVPGDRDALRDVAAERERQKTVEGWTPEHDDKHTDRDLARAAACCALHTEPVGNVGDYLRFWPWDADWWKPKDHRRNLIKAGALILAEIERLNRAAIPGAEK